MNGSDISALTEDLRQRYITHNTGTEASATYETFKSVYLSFHLSKTNFMVQGLYMYIVKESAFMEHEGSLLCKIWGSHGADYEKWHILGWYAVWLL
jgi:hypothetical protein